MTALMRTMGHPSPALEAFDRLFQSAFTPFYRNGEAGQASIPTNVWETADAYQIAMLVPGVDPQSIDVTAVGKAINVAGAIQVNQPEGGRLIWQEFGPTRFRRQVGLPADFDSSQVRAEYRDGVVLISVPKAEHSRARTIKVNVQK